MIIGIDASRATTRQRTGTEAYAYFLIRALIPLLDPKHQLRLYFNQAPPPDLFPSHPQAELVGIPFPRLWTHIRLAWELQRRPPDLFFTPSHVIPFTYFGRSMATVHDLGYHHFPATHPKRQLAYLRWSTRHNGRRSQRVIADSAVTKADLVHFDGIDPAKIEVVYPGIDATLKPEKDAGKITAVLRKYDITPPYLLFISTLQPRKNLHRLIRAYAASDVAHQLVLAGKPGWLSRPIREEIANCQSSIANSQLSICLPGFIEDEDKAALLSGATALLYPSLYEGFGFPVLEAQACGTAVLTANTSSLPEIAADAALFVDPLDTGAITAGIQQLVSEPALRQELVQKGLENVKRFSWQKTAAHLLEIMNDELLIVNC